MLDMGFLPSIKRILAKLPKQDRQTLLFSATFAEPIKALAREFMVDPLEIQVTPKNTVADTIAHRVHPVDSARKRELLLHLLAADTRVQTLVFAKTKHGSDKLATSWRSPASRPRRSTATRARPSACARCAISRPARSTCWWPPTSPRAASISTSCPR